MKILSFEEFTSLPDGVIYSHYCPPDIAHETNQLLGCDGLYRRGKVYRDAEGRAEDFDEISLIGEPAPEGGYDELEVAESVVRWGLFEFDQQFAVYEEEELRRIAGLIWRYVLRDEMASAFAGAQRWTPVSNPPKTSASVLVLHADSDRPSVGRYRADSIGGYYDPQWWSERLALYQANEPANRQGGYPPEEPPGPVTHWMPLPSFPEGE